MFNGPALKLYFIIDNSLKTSYVNASELLKNNSMSLDSTGKKPEKE